MEIRQNLEANFLTCKICNEAFRQPKVLICMHTFCKQCLESILERDKLEAAKKRREIETQRSSGYSSSSSTSTYKGKWSNAFKSPIFSKNESYVSSLNGYSKHRFSEDEIMCPLCQKRTTLPLSGVHGLPDDQVAGKLALLVGTLPKYPVCEVCSAGVKALHMQPKQVPVVSEISRIFIPQRSWTDAEDGSTSDPQSTEDDDEKCSMVFRRSSGFQSNLFRNSRRSNPMHKIQTINISDDDHSIFSTQDNSTTSSEPNRAISMCLECTKKLCTSCGINHTKTGLTSDHIVLPLEKIDELSCIRHPKELKRFYCITCGELICLVCTFDSNFSDENSCFNGASVNVLTHVGHQVLPIRQGLSALESTIKSLNNECHGKANYVESVLRGMRTCEKHVISLENSINTAADKLIHDITSQKEKLLQDIELDLGVSLETYFGQCEQIHRALDIWEQLSEAEDINLEFIHIDEPLGALNDAEKLRQKFRSCLNTLSEAVPQDNGWINLIAEIENLQSRSDFKSYKSSELISNVQSEIIKESCENAKPLKHVRFAPPEEIPDIISVSQSAYWTRRLGTFILGTGAHLGRRLTPSQLASEARIQSEKFTSRQIQASPTDIYGKPLPQERDSHRHRAIQTNPLNSNKRDSSTQTEHNLFNHNSIRASKIDSGTQYTSSDINTPVSFFRSSKQIVVQK